MSNEQIGLVTGRPNLAPIYMQLKRGASKIAIEVILWLLSIRLIMVFARAGWDKFDASSGWAKAFATWGYPEGFRLLIGALEVGAAVLLVWPRTAAYAAAIIIAIMLGGMGTHVFVEHRPARVTSELAHLLLAAIVLAGRWPSRITTSNN
jgi:putative oxidoreductase